MPRLRSLAYCLTALLAGSAALATPVTFTGQAQISSVDNTHGQLGDFLGAAPAAGDILTLSITYDSATLGPQQQTGFPNTVLYTGGVTAVSLTLNGVTLVADTTGPNLASVLVSTNNSPVLGIPGFYDGYGLTGGSVADANGKRWAVNFFFYYGGLTSLAAPSTIPTFSQFQFVGLGYRSFDANQQFDSFGSLVQSLAAPEPSLGLLGLAAFGLLGVARRRTR